jgi:hydrogenase maturation protease
VPAERITVMGVGNPLMRDEGVGVRVAEVLMSSFEWPENVTVLDAGTMGIGILNLFRDADYLLVVDAVENTGEAPGTVVRLSAEDIAPNQVMHSLHDVRFIDVLEAADLMGIRPDSDFVGVQVADMGEDSEQMEVGLTPAVEAAVPDAVAAVLTVLAKRGVHPQARTDAEADARVLEALRTRERMPDAGEASS